jgi:hypothetical protein
MVSTHAIIGGHDQIDDDSTVSSSSDLAELDEQSIESDEEYTDYEGSLKDFVVDDDVDDDDDDGCDDDEYEDEEYDDNEEHDDEYEDEECDDDEEGDGGGEDEEPNDNKEDDILASALEKPATIHRHGAIVAYIDRDGFHPFPGFESQRLRSGIRFHVREHQTESGI